MLPSFDQCRPPGQNRVGIAGRLMLASLSVVMLLMPAAVWAGSIFDDDDSKPMPPPPPTLSPPGSPAPFTPAKPSSPSPHVDPPPRPLPPPATSRRPVPTKQDQDQSRRLFRVLFAKDLADGAPAARSALAAKLRDAAAQCADKPADQYVLLAGARRAALDARNLDLGLTVDLAITVAFDVDPLALKAQTVMGAGLAGNTPDATWRNCELAVAVLDELVAAEDYTTAGALAAALQKASVDDPFLRWVMPRRAREIEALRFGRDQAGRDLLKLKEDPANATATQSLAFYVCFTKGDWKQGLALLAKVPDTSMQRLAKIELASPPGGDDLRKLADGWAAIAARQPEPQKSQILQHALELYDRCAGTMTGMQKLLVDSDMQKAGKSCAPRYHDLLALVDPAVDQVKGRWLLVGGNLQIGGEASRLELPYIPPREYVYRTEYTTAGEMDVVMGLYKQSKSFQWEVGAANNKLAGFEDVDGKAVWQRNRTVTDYHLDRERPHISVVEVSDNQLRAWVDGRLLKDWPTNYSEFDIPLPEQHHPRDPTHLAIGVWNSKTTFHRIEVVELSGIGRVLRDKTER